MKRLTAFVQDESGATAIEYALIATGIAIAIIAMVRNVGNSLNNTFVRVNNGLK